MKFDCCIIDDLRESVSLKIQAHR